MANLNDVKSYEINVNTGSTKKDKTPFIPSATPDNDGSHAQQDPNLGRPNYMNDNVPSKVTIDMITNKASKVSKASEVHKADFSSLPKESTRAEIGIDKKKSIQDDVFKAGGPFDKMIERRKAEYAADMQELDRQAARKMEEKSLDADDLEDDTNIGNVSNINEVDIIKQKLEKDRTNMNDNGIQGLESVTGLADAVAAETAAKKVEQDKFINSINKKATAVNKSEDNKAAEKELSPEEAELEDGFNDDVIEDDNEEEPIHISKPVVAESIEEEEPIEEPAKQPLYTDSAEEVISIKEESSPLPIAKEPTKKPVKSSADMINMVTKEYMGEVPEDSDDDSIKETSNDDDSDAKMEILKDLISKKINPVNKKLDLSMFSIATKGTKSSTILSNEAASVAKWVLPSTGIVVKMREVSGSNFELLRSDLENSPANIRGALKILYDHIVSAKPEFNQWLNSVAFDDYDHLFMATYIASFSGANYIPIDCTNKDCEKPFLTDNIPMMDMVKFKDEKCHQKFLDLYDSDAVEYKGLYTSAVVSISDKFAIGFRDPSLYSVLIEANYFTGNQNFYNKYQSTIAYLPYIDNLYYIDKINYKLVPITYTEYANNVSKTARSKVQRYDHILNTLTADQYAAITANITAIGERVNWFTYIVPETTCPWCNTVIKEAEDQQARGLVFLRNRLGVLATI